MGKIIYFIEFSVIWIGSEIFFHLDEENSIIVPPIIRRGFFIGLLNPFFVSIITFDIFKLVYGWII